MNRKLPPLALLLGLAGLLPFLACGVLALGQYADRGAFALVAYGAVILAFLGGVHWGFALEDPTRHTERARLAGGILPSLVGWVALLLTLAVRVDFGLALLLLGFIGTTAAEARATRLGLVPRGYMGLRWVLSATVCLVLLSVIVLRLLGAHILV